MTAEVKFYTREELLNQIPKNAKRISVNDRFGNDCWRNIEKGFDAILDTDKINHKEGVPIVMTRAPGRPPTKNTPVSSQKPLKPGSAKAAELQREKASYLRNDELLNAIARDPDQEKVFDFLLLALAHEQSALGFLRARSESDGEPVSQLSIRRVNALKTMSDILFKRKEQKRSNNIDFESTSFRRLFKFMLETFKQSMVEADLSEGKVNQIFEKLADRMGTKEWEDEAKNRVENG